MTFKYLKRLGDRSSHYCLRCKKRKAVGRFHVYWSFSSNDTTEYNLCERCVLYVNNVIKKNEGSMYSQ